MDRKAYDPCVKRLPAVCTKITAAVTDFAAAIAAGYAVECAAIDLGRGVHEGKLVAEAVVRLPLAAVVVLSEKGVPTPVVDTRLRGPQASMS